MWAILRSGLFYAIHLICNEVSSFSVSQGHALGKHLDLSRLQGETYRNSSFPSNKKELINPFIASCDDSNNPPSLIKLISSIQSLKSGSDVRGIYTDHTRMGSILNVSHAIKSERSLTPFAAFCYGTAFAQEIKLRSDRRAVISSARIRMEEWGNETVLSEKTFIICVGRDPRLSGTRLADAFCRGAESVDGIVVHYTGLAATPAMFEFCRSGLCDGAVMITASHLPEDRNGMKFFTKTGGLTSHDIEALAENAIISAKKWHDLGVIPPLSGGGAVFCTSQVDHMPHYMKSLRYAIVSEVEKSGLSGSVNTNQSLAGLKIVLNPGKGSGCFFNEILESLGADVSNSMHLVPDGTFPLSGVPNPEHGAMIEETSRNCLECGADIGIMLDTDADRSGFIVPTSGEKKKYEPLNRNRLIALLAVIFQSSSPGCTIVTDSVTSEGIASFLSGLGIEHVRYLKGYANVIGKAQELVESGEANAEVAIETSGHCAMRENGFLDDGIYTSVKIIGLLARLGSENGYGAVNLLNLISELEEMDEVKEFRLNVKDGSMNSTERIFRDLVTYIEDACVDREDWELDCGNLEGVRVRIGDGGFFMMRKSLHDPILCLQAEGLSKELLQTKVVEPFMNLIGEPINLDTSCLNKYLS